VQVNLAAPVAAAAVAELQSSRLVLQQIILALPNKDSQAVLTQLLTMLAVEVEEQPVLAVMLLRLAAEMVVLAIHGPILD
jgi:hypothetical protein